MCINVLCSKIQKMDEITKTKLILSDHVQIIPIGKNEVYYKKL